MKIEIRAWYPKNQHMITWFDLKQSAWNTFRGDTPLSLIYEILVARKDEFKVMMFTGKENNFGEKIFQGDILTDQTEVDGQLIYGYYPVVWCNERCGWAVDISYSKDGSLLESLECYSNYKIGGNIYENPNLLISEDKNQQN